jgi:hypothetical protein
MTSFDNYTMTVVLASFDGTPIVFGFAVFVTLIIAVVGWALWLKSVRQSIAPIVASSALRSYWCLQVKHQVRLEACWR